MTKQERREKPCFICTKPEYAHPGGQFCKPPAPKPTLGDRVKQFLAETDLLARELHLELYLDVSTPSWSYRGYQSTPTLRLSVISTDTNETLEELGSIVFGGKANV